MAKAFEYFQLEVTTFARLNKGTIFKAFGCQI